MAPANAPPALLSVQLPAIAIANKIPKLTIKNQPISSIIFPNKNNPWSPAKSIPIPLKNDSLKSLPTEINIPPAGITATTIINALENLCQNSKPRFSFMYPAGFLRKATVLVFNTFSFIFICPYNSIP